MVGVGIYWDYDLPESDTKTIEDDNRVSNYFPEFWCAFNASLLSTTADIRPAHAAFKHSQKKNTLATNIHWQVS